MKTYLLILMSAAALASGADVVSAESDESRANEGRSGDHRDHRDHVGHGGAGGEFRDPARMVERMAEHLDLDETQQQNISNIIGAAKPEIGALRERAKVNRQAMHALDPADSDYSAKLNNLAIENGELVVEGSLLFGRIRAEVAAELSEEQRAELAASTERRRDRFRHGRRGADTQ